MAILFRHGIHACGDGVCRLPAGRPVDGSGNEQNDGVAPRRQPSGHLPRCGATWLRRWCSQSRNTGFEVKQHVPKPAPSAIYCSLTAYRSGSAHRIASPLDEYPAWRVVTSQISDPLIMLPGSLNSVAPLGPSVGIGNPRAKAPTLFRGTEIDSVTAKVGYSFSA